MSANHLSEIKSGPLSVRSKEKDEFDLAELVSFFSSHIWTIATIAAAIFLISVIYAFTVTPVYRAVALIEVEEKKEGIPGLSDIAELNLLSEGSAGNKDIILMKSYSILGEVVDSLSLNLEVVPRVFPLIGPVMYSQFNGNELAEPLFGLASYAWGGESIDVGHFTVTGDLSRVASRWQGFVGENNEYQLLNSDGEVLLIGNVGENASIGYMDSHLDLMINRMHARPGQYFSINYIPRNMAIEKLKELLNVSEDGKDTGIILISLDGENNDEIIEILNHISNIYVEDNKDKHVKDAQVVLDFIDEQLPQLKNNLEEAQRNLQEFRQRVGTVDMEFETKNALTAIMEYEKMIIEMEVDREKLRRQFTENAPDVKVLDKQIEKIKDKISTLESKMHVLPEKEWEFLQKSMEVDVASQLYVTLLNKALELRVTKASAVANVRIIDSAELLSKPVKPRKVLILFVGLVSGLMLGTAWVLMRNILHQGVEDPEFIEHETGIPVYANIPHSDVEDSIHSKIINRNGIEKNVTKLLAFENDSDLAMEAMRSFRTNMRFTMKNAESNVMIISGPSPSIGKSFFSSNYSAIAAKDGQRVLLIDADMRKGHLHKQMGVSISPGLSELIRGDVVIDDVIHEISDNYYFISCGERPPNSSELVSSTQFQDLLGRLRQRQGLIIFDTPPILAVADASIIAQYGGHLFLLLRSGQHAIGEIMAATTKFQKSGVKISGIILNDVKKETNRYGYTYEYK